MGHLDAAWRIAEQALAAANAAADGWATGWALAVLAFVYGMRGEPALAIPLLDQALVVADGDPGLTDLRLVLRINRATSLCDLGRNREALTTAGEAQRMAQGAGNLRRLAQANSVLAETYYHAGSWDNALTLVVSPSRRCNDPVVECCIRGIAAVVELHRGNTRAMAHISDADAYSRSLNGRPPAFLMLARSLEREQAHEPVQALAILTEQFTAEETDATAGLLADAVRLAAAIDDRCAARRLVDQAEALAPASAAPYRHAIASHCRGLFDQDPDLLMEAAERYRTAGRLLPRAQALEAAGAALANQGEIAGAVANCGEAESLYAGLRASRDVTRIRAAVESYERRT
jgi:tetratricopeptide (TPR) repeat protein